MYELLYYFFRKKLNNITIFVCSIKNSHHFKINGRHLQAGMRSKQTPGYFANPIERVVAE